MKLIEVRDGATTQWVWAHREDGKLWYHYRGQSKVIALDERRVKTKSSQGAGARGEIFAPMPGKITKVAVQVGQAVKLGEVLIVMEAMKMEYTLKAESAGSVDQILVQVGDQVTLGKLLVKLQVGK